MSENIIYYIALITLVIIGVITVKKIVSCFFRFIIILVLLAIGAYIYFQYLNV